MGLNKYNIPVPITLGGLRKWAGVNPLIVNYHMVSDRTLPHLKHLYPYRDEKGFREDMKFLLSRYRPVNLEELLESVRASKPLPENAFMLTFDDGFREMHDTVAPILQELKLPATFFLSGKLLDNKELQTDNQKSLLVEQLLRKEGEGWREQVTGLLDQHGIPGKQPSDRILMIPHTRKELLAEISQITGFDPVAYLGEHRPYMTSDQVREMLDAGFTIGGHSLDHTPYYELTLEEQVLQTLSSVEILRDLFDIEYRVFAFPFSDLGVSSAFFDEISDRLDATFSTRGLLSDPVPTNFQRISLEKLPGTALQSIKFHYLRRIIYKLRKREMISRG